LRRWGLGGVVWRHRRWGVAAGGGLGAQQLLLVVPRLVGVGHRVDDAGVHRERAAGVAQHAGRPVRDDHGGQRGAVAAVFFIDVLDDFFAALVFEIDVDVGRLVAFLADDTLEQRLALVRVARGYVLATTHHLYVRST